LFIIPGDIDDDDDEFPSLVNDFEFLFCFRRFRSSTCKRFFSNSSLDIGSPEHV
jgi:hypothetical protein